MMSSKLYKLTVVLFIFIFISCSEEVDEDTGIEDAPPAYEVNILPLGDSRVQGNRPNHESYRFELWKNFIGNDWTVDFLGPNIDDSEYPQFLGLDFDKNHAGVGGYTTRLILTDLENTLANVETPDIILLGIGGVDLIRDNSYEAAILNIHEIINILQEHNPDITIFIEQIAPAKSDIYTDEDLILFNGFNDNIMTVAQERSTADSNVISIDMTEGWNDILLADDIHYNALGAKFVADKYFEAIDEQM